MIITTKTNLDTESVSLAGQRVETVKNFKYLCTGHDYQLSFSGNTDSLLKKILAASLPKKTPQPWCQQEDALLFTSLSCDISGHGLVFCL